ncbi:MAG TPA: mycothiol system anti-sigma-R factor [Actinomycetota bacterium]|nr:mycothiol system anti-sigma-R factor [Actinomycetota bacterium]
MGNAETDCRQVLERLYLYIDGEIAGGDCASIEAHLKACPPCMQHVDFEKNLKEVVRRKCTEGAAPPELAAKLKLQIQSMLGGS